MAHDGKEIMTDTITRAELEVMLSAARAAAMEEAKLAITQLAEDTGRQGCCGEGVQSHLGPPECCGIPITLIDAESAFDALTTLATTPPGWVCVPVEPTEAMLDAALWTGVFDTNQNGCDADAVTKAYRAMIAAPGAKE